MVTAGRAADVLAEIVGSSQVRDAAAGDAVSGVMPALVVSPGSAAEVAAVLQACAEQGLTVVVRGGGTQMSWGAPPLRCEVLLSTSRLDAMVEYEPGDSVCVVGAGMPLATLQARAAEHGQRLALDPPGCGVAATVGGILAAGASGPLRTHFGTARDLVLGMRFVVGDGVIGSSGGKVVKNVAGYDVGKLLIGSLGTLAVITEVSLRLHPLPQAVRTVACQELTPAQVDAARRVVERAPVEAAAMVALSPGGALLVRCEGTAAGVEAQASALLGLLRAVAPLARVLDEAEADRAWAYAESCVWGGDPVDPVANVVVPRAAIGALLAELAETPHQAVALPATGSCEVRLTGTPTPADITALRGFAEQHGGSLTLRRGTPALAHLAWPAVGDDDASIDLMRALKRALDPHGTLAPGRHLGGI